MCMCILGTPSLASPGTIESVLNVVALNSSLDDNAEVTLEANPTSAQMAKLRCRIIHRFGQYNMAMDKKESFVQNNRVVGIYQVK